MMSVKKNLTVATLAALLAVPAFGATNASYTLHMPSVTAHADDIGKNPTNTWWNTPAVTDPQNIHVLGYTPKTAAGEGDYTVSIDGKTEYATPDSPLGREMQSMNIGASNSSNVNDSQDNSSSSESNGNYQYTSQSGQLPQTNENDGASKAMALGASALVAGAGLMALSFARKHKYLESVDLVSNTDTVSASNDKGNDNDTPKYSNKSSYDMIMSNAFNDISKSLKNM